MPSNPLALTFGQLAALSMTAPFVVGQRIAIMAAAGCAPTKADRREYARMSAEKWKATSDGLWEMTRATMDWQYRNWVAMWMPFGTGARFADMRDVDRILAAGLRPATKAVSANLRRLPRRRRS